MPTAATGLRGAIGGTATMTEYVQRYAIRATETEQTVTLPAPATSAPLEVTNRPDDEWNKRSVTVLGAGEPVILEAGERAAFRPIAVGQDKYEWLRDDTAVWPPSFAEDAT
jgi:hypothetical protein